MGKYEAKKPVKARKPAKAAKRQKRKARRSGLKTAVVVLSCLLVIGALALFFVPQLLYRLNPETEPIEDGNMYAETHTADPADAVPFPAVLDGGNIEIESLFSFSGVNPDARKQEADDVASIVLKNLSGSYLREATVTATLADGSALQFAVEDVPSGASVMAFSTDNAQLLATDLCTDIAAEAVFEEATGNAGVECAVDGMTVTVANTAAEALQNVIVYYRDVFDGKYFGGKTYCYTIEKLSAGESMTFTAEESLLGVIEVVRIAVNNQN